MNEQLEIIADVTIDESNKVFSLKQKKNSLVYLFF